MPSDFVAGHSTKTVNIFCNKSLDQLQLRLQRCEALRVFQTLLTQRQLAERCTNLRVNKTGFETVKVGLNYVELTSF
jgi:hypothetical protein